MKLVQHTWPNLRNQIVLCLLTSLSVKGLAIIADTYSNHNGPHNHQHPYISAMVNNGSLTYDHDRLLTKVNTNLFSYFRDGTHTMLGGCEVKFRNMQHETWIAIRWHFHTSENFEMMLYSNDCQVTFKCFSWCIKSAFQVWKRPTDGESRSCKQACLGSLCFNRYLIFNWPNITNWHEPKLTIIFLT